MEDEITGHIHTSVDIMLTPNIEELKARVAQLELNLREEKEARTLSELDKAQLRTETEELRSDLLSLDTYTLQLRQQRNGFQTELASQIESATASAQRSDTLVKALRDGNSSLESELSRLKEENTKLQQELIVKEPLFEMGKKVRIRYLAQAREMVLFVKPRKGDTIQIERQELDKVGIENGNLSAHGGNGKADAALFQGNFLSETERYAYWVVFQALYKTPPQDYGTRSPKYLEIMDHEATIRTLKVLNDTLNRPLEARVQALIEIDILKEKYAKMDDATKFDADREVDRRLTLVRTCTRKIVEYDRQKDGRGCKEDKGPGELSRVCLAKRSDS
jgi:hypothetical protein